MIRSLGIRRRLALLVIAGATPFFVYAVVRAQAQASDARAATDARALDIARRVAARISLRLSALEEELDLLAGIVSPEVRDTARNIALLERAVGAIKDLDVVLFVSDSAGRIVGRSNWKREPGVVDIADRDYFADVKRTRKRAIGGATLQRPENKVWGVVVARPILEGEVFRGMVGAALRVRSFQPYVAAAGLPEGSVIALRDSGTVIARSAQDQLFVGTNALPIATIRRQIALRDGVIETVWLDGITRVTGFTSISGSRWQLSVGIPAANALAPVRRALLYEIFIAALTLTAGVVAVLYLGNGLVDPVQELTRDARAIASGDEGHRTRVTAGGEIGELAGSFNAMAAQIADRNDALRESEHRARVLFDQNPAPAAVYDIETLDFLDVNEAALRLYGYSRGEFVRMRVSDVVVPGQAPITAVALPPVGAPPMQVAGQQHRTSSGDIRVVELFISRTAMQGRPVAIAVGIDVTERLAAQRALAESKDQLRQAQKMESIGRLTGGIAHDFNNLLTGIIGHSDFALEMLDQSHPSYAEISSARDTSWRAATLTQQLLAFSRRQVVPKTAVDITALVRGLEPTLQRLMPDRITLTLKSGPGVGLVSAAESQIEQVLMNLVVNARDAIAATGLVTIEVARESLTVATAAPLGLTSGEYVRLSVTDDGVGMDEGTRTQIFEPFFTTKAPGSGTGLGLATVYGIVQEAGGAVHVTSTLGEGSRFDVRLPRLPGSRTPSSTAPAVEPLVARPVALPPGGNETVLLAEDEPVVRRLVESILRRLGYTVLAAANGEQALALLAAHEGKVDLLLSDVVMPGLSGRELAEHVAALRPEVRVLLVSGYHQDSVLHDGVERQRVAFLPKPFTPAALALRVRAVLDAPE